MSKMKISLKKGFEIFTISRHSSRDPTSNYGSPNGHMQTLYKGTLISPSIKVVVEQRDDLESTLPNKAMRVNEFSHQMRTSSFGEP